MELAPATPADAPALAGIFLRCWRIAYRGVVDDDVIDGLEPAEVEGWWRRLTAEHPVVAARVDGDLVGMIRFGPEDGAGARGHVFSLYVDPAAAGGGIGRALLARAESELAAHGFATATLWVFAANERALRFYRAAGWAPTGETRVEPEWRVPELQLATELRER